MCFTQKVSQQEKDAQAGQAALFKTMTDQAQQIFGASSKVFNSLYTAFAPIVAAGPNQEGYSVAQMSNLMSQAVTGAGVAGRNALSAVRSLKGNLPSGAAIGAELGTASAIAQSAAQMQSNIRQESAQLGYQHFAQAASVLGGAPSVFGAATSAGGAATGAGSASAQTAEDITKVQNAPGIGMGIIGAIGGVLGSAVGGGGMLSGVLGGAKAAGSSLGAVTNGGINASGMTTSGFPGMQL